MAGTGEAKASPGIVTFLSFLFPGLGHLYARHTRAAAVFAIPVLVLIGFVLLQLPGGIDTFAAQLIAPSFALGTLLVIVVLGVWRLVSIGHAFRLSPVVARRRRSAIAVLLAAVIGVGAMHGVAGYYALLFYDAGTQIFGPEATPSPGPIAGASESPGPSGSFGLETPSVTLPPPTNRVTFLLTGVDSARDRTQALTDTLLVVSVNRDTGEAVMLSIPRDTSRFPMYSGGTYNGKINSLMTYAGLRPKQYPDGGMGTLAREIGYLIGVPVNYYAAINLDGFQSMVDLVGGVDIVNPKWIRDPVYDWFDGTQGFTLSPGKHHLNGKVALAYVRSRYGAGDNDFTRAARQQELLVALASKMGSTDMLAKLPQILKVAAKTIRTDFPADEIRDYLILAKEIDKSKIQKFVLGPPYAVHPPTNSTGGIYILELQFDEIAALSIRLFGTDSRYFNANPSPSVAP
ncbi:MAG: LCP family protein [Chloroflexota bacterium]